MTTYQIIVSDGDWPYDDLELRDDAGDVLARGRGARGDVDLRTFAYRALGDRFACKIVHPPRPRRGHCGSMPGDVICEISPMPAVPAPAPGQKPTHCRCRNPGPLRYCRKCQQYRCRACMTPTDARCYTCNQRNKEDDMGMKARPTRAVRRVVRQHDTHKLGPGGCGKFGTSGTSTWDYVTCKDCLQNHPDRVEVPAFVEDGVRVLVHNALVAAVEKGLRIKKGGCATCGGGRPNGSVCCVCAPILFREHTLGDKEEADDVCAKILGVPGKWLYDFVSGFDGGGRPGMYPTAFAVGRRLARRHGAA